MWLVLLLLSLYLFASANAKFGDVDPEQYTNEEDDNNDENMPPGKAQNVLIVVGPNCAQYGSQKNNIYKVARGPVVLPNCFGVVRSAIERWDSPHGEPDEILDQDQDADENAKYAMEGVPMRAVASELVDFDDGDANDK